jgi:hypothetical protein
MMVVAGVAALTALYLVHANSKKKIGTMMPGKE